MFHGRAPAHKTIEGVSYLNCGDWVNSCTALVEAADGRFSLIAWHTLNEGTDGSIVDRSQGLRTTRRIYRLVKR